MRNTPELEGLAAITHRSGAVGWALVVAGGSLAIGGHLLGVRYNRARGNRIEVGFHRAALVVAGVAVVFGLAAIGLEARASVIHARDARDRS